MRDLYIYKKVVDWSLLTLGIAIPLEFRDIFYDCMKFKLQKGNSKKIKLIIDSIEYKVDLININFDNNKYPNSKEILQIRYTENSPIALKIKEIFSCSYKYLFSEREKLSNKRRQIKVPKEIQEYIAIYSTIFEDTFIVDCITTYDINQAKTIVNSMNEIYLEEIFNSKDSSTNIIKKDKLIKIRKLDKSISEKLKQIYEYRCQICGFSTKEQYGVNIIHAHHIEYFSLSLNNNPNNIMILCPNHHSIVHSSNPIFDRKHKSFKYSNGYIEPLKFNYHL